MNKKRLDEIRTRAEAATRENVHGWMITSISYLDLYRQDIPDLLAYVEELEKQLDELEKHFAPLAISHPHLVPDGWGVSIPWARNA